MTYRPRFAVASRCGTNGVFAIHERCAAAFDEPIGMNGYSCPPHHAFGLSVKEHLQTLVGQALRAVYLERGVEFPALPPIIIERTRDKAHGDFATNAAMVYAKPAGMKPRDLATSMLASMPTSMHVDAVEIAGPGFINFRLGTRYLYDNLREVLAKGADFGRVITPAADRITVEYVSANPTGPLHVGHGRGAAFGASLSNVLEACGIDVQREYYVNDNGRQMDILAASVWLRYLDLAGVSVRFPDNGYKSEDYIYAIARQLLGTHAMHFRRDAEAITADLPLDESQGGDKEAHIDAIVARCKALLGTQDFRVVFDAGLNAILDDIRDDLGGFGVSFNEWFSERSLATSGAIDRAVERLTQLGHMYEEKGALWFRATTFGDEKDRVVIRENGAATYFASDIAYLLNKFDRGFTRAIYIFGADHHGYIARLKAAASGLGLDPDKLEILLVQFAVLYRGETKVQMSTRSGQFVTLRELREEVGSDACRFFYIMRSNDQHLDFDLELAKRSSRDNPVFYVQYAYARIASVLRQLGDRALLHDVAAGDAALDQLTDPYERALLDNLRQFPETVTNAGADRAPHRIANYLRELAAALHSYYDGSQIKILGDDEALRNARLNLLLGVRQVLANGLKLIGVSAPEKM